jgi:hypothetical protein
MNKRLRSLASFGLLLVLGISATESARAADAQPAPLDPPSLIESLPGEPRIPGLNWGASSIFPVYGVLARLAPAPYIRIRLGRSAYCGLVYGES